MIRWLVSDVPVWVTGPIFLIGLPAFMLLLQDMVHRRAPHWRRGEHNDATGIMLSAAAVVYSVAIGLCVVTLWDKLEGAQHAAEAEATNLGAIAEGSRVFDAPVRDLIGLEVIRYNKNVVDTWPSRIRGDDNLKVDRDLDQLVETVGQIKPETEAQRAFVADAVTRLTRASELREVALREAREQQLPGVLWVAVVGGSIVVLGLCLTCGVSNGVLRRILLVGVAATVGINLFLIVELAYPFYGSVSVKPDSYTSVITELQHAR